jgi:hypothetical protein
VFCCGLGEGLHGAASRPNAIFRLAVKKGRPCRTAAKRASPPGTPDPNQST